MSRPIEILHLAYTHFPADTRVKRETEALLGTGRRVGVIALRRPGERAVERWNGITVLRVPGTKSRGGVLSYVTEYAGFVWRCRALIARHRRLARVRVVHVHTLPDFLMWAALPARSRGARVVFDIHEIFPEFVRAKYPSLWGRFAAGVAGSIERWARRRADLTITVNQPIDELLASRPIRRPERRLILHNTADPVDFGEPAAPSSDQRRLDLVYHGTLTFLYGLDLAIRGVASARERGLDARFTILGDGPTRTALRDLTTDLGLTDFVRLEAPVVQRDLPRRLTACAAGLVPTRLDGMTQYSLSTKLLEYVHLGIPVLAARLPSYRRYFPEDAMWFWTAGDPQDLARAIAEFARAPAPERMRRARLAQTAIASLAWNRERAGLLAAYHDLLDRSSQRESTQAIRSAAFPSP
jgi:glycosyltransferase involved in cell wall biosynthesis